MTLTDRIGLAQTVPEIRELAEEYFRTRDGYSLNKQRFLAIALHKRLRDIEQKAIVDKYQEEK